MDSLQKFLFSSLLLLAAAVNETRADALVTGTVFCDQCKEGQRSVFDYPLNGVKVVVACTDNNGQVSMWKGETTNWLGNYAMRFDGSPDLSGCYAQVSVSGEESTGCAAVAGPAQGLRLLFKMFYMEIYAVDSLLSQPAQPMASCPGSIPEPVTPPNPPTIRFPPIRPLPPVPFWEGSVCPYENWTMPEYICHWKVVGPDTKVAVAFGLIAARRYGTDMSLKEGLQGRGDLYMTLLREGTAALLNSYNSLQFVYPTLVVIERMNWALLGSPQQALLTALLFSRANSGFGNVRCNLTPCK
ncbi:hypothetical protein HHK36_010288 [Tetracentron sinense]|uniref:Pollen Ole e 1 allergen and extensin family protein n=1 Tax=Tetracentron sinense TaxID=13715 RepID=A0A834ZCJ3_TETSI|nr:hypothetical protein HHK36_010288 [Tetracentron sinense]